MKFSVCIETIFAEVPFARRLELLKTAGVSTFEFWTWQDKDISLLKKLKNHYDMQIAVFTGVNSGLLTPGFLTPETKASCLKELKQSIEAAQQLNCKNLVVHVGNTAQLSGKLTHQQQYANLVDGLKKAGEMASAKGITLLLEPLNTLIDHPDYFLDSSKEAFKILGEVSRANMKLLYDIYHLQIMEGNLLSTIKQNIARIGYFHLAGVPGRNEPDWGEVDYAFLINEIRKLGYDGYFGFEYFPTIPSAQSLSRVVKNLRSKNLISQVK